MLRPFPACLLALLFSSCFISVAAYSQSLTPEQAAQSRTWLKLLHFDKTPAFGRPHSAVIDPDFFLSAHGANNPTAELEATINALQMPDAGEGEHAACKFPARAMWLEEQGLVTPVTAQCEKRDEWLQKHSKNEVGVMFASGYLGNPASFFGHMLLHLGSNTNTNQSPIQLLDTSLNFGADTQGDSILPYMWKGLFSGYTARYSSAPFFRNSALYSESEMRDLWHYEFNLTEHDRRFLIAHMWEIQGQDFDYLFLSENCASRIARTLELVVHENLAHSPMPWVAPEQVMIQLSNATYNGEPLVRSRLHKPSRRLQTEQYYHQLNEQQQRAVVSLWANPAKLEFNDNAFRMLSTTDRAPVVDVILSHLLTLEESGSELPIAELRQQALVQRLQLPTGSGLKPEPAPAPIENASPSGMWRATAFAASERSNGLRLSARPLHYDMLQSDSTRMPYAALELGRVDLDITANTVRLHHLQLFDVTNLHARRTPLHEVNEIAWQMKAQISNRSLACNSCLDGSLELNAGWSGYFNGWVPFALTGFQVRTTGYQDGFLAATLHAGFFRRWNSEHSSYLTVSHLDSLQGQSGRLSSLKLQHRSQLSREFDLRFHLATDTYGSEAGFGVSYYW
ncbi:Lnb N-terminal periplasmic domain-containing protein [Aliidiomarina celeris]|uniref:Lnb N-terminal periplasmic domain-containing protein n=1 Tax=Aliidiomarina celeris TaxID=2249428 RepID=UPI000DE93AC5|nr:DUF4105 domain-containing protein [Aliidiomarina celeris]